ASDAGFILLGEVVRRESGDRLDRYLKHVFFDPLGLQDTMFQPRDAVKSRVAPTEFVGGHLLQGEVHDARARLLGGVAGHAGIFSTAADLARLCRMLLSEGALDGRRYLKPETVALMWEPDPDARATRTLDAGAGLDGRRRAGGRPARRGAGAAARVAGHPGARAHRTRRRRRARLLDVPGPLGRARHEPDGRGRAGAAGDRPLCRGAGGASARDLLARARDHRRGERGGAEHARPDDAP